MELIKDKKFGGERPLFAQHDLRLENVTITDGESGDRKSTRLNSSHIQKYRMPSSA